MWVSVLGTPDMKRALLLTIRLYQRLLSPLLLPACRYVPTCSQYAHEAVELHGSAKGAMLAAWRLLRCHPLARGGYDPVPLDETLHNPALMRLALLTDATPDETLHDPALMLARLHDATPDTTLDNPAFMRWVRLNDATHPSGERLDTRIPEGCNDNSPALQCRVAGTTRPQVP
jgi:putative membrane protein insertion efficiency factor